MAKFTFNLPNGRLFTLDGPPGSTVEQAELIFLEQLASGALIGLRPGDVLQSPITVVRKFELSRLDRGTAGVEDIPLIAIYSGGAITTSSESSPANTAAIAAAITTAVAAIAAAQDIAPDADEVAAAIAAAIAAAAATITTTALTVVSSLPQLTDIPVVNGITTADYLAQTTVTESVGPLNPGQVQGVLAAIAAFVCQTPGTVTNAAGLGKYGLTAMQLEQAGYLKPGTTCRFVTNPDEFVNVTSSDSVWTGLNGVTSVNNILNSPALQDKIQLGIMQSSYSALVQSGQIVVSANASPGASTFDSRLLSALGIAAAATGTIAGLQNTATNLVNAGIAQVTGAIDTVVGTINTVTGVIDSTITRISNLPNVVTNFVNNGIANVAGLIANASKFGVDTALRWAKGLIPARLFGQMQQLAKLGQFAVNFVDFKLPLAVAGIAPAAGYAGTVNRDTLNAATAKLIGSDKIPLPNFAPVTIASGAMTALAKQAKNVLAGITGAVTGAVNSVVNRVTGVVGRVAGAVSSARSAFSAISSFF
jgi:hypothetical protein